MTNKRTGMVTEIDQAVMDWLETHHIRAKDVRAWSGVSRIGDISTVTLEVYISGVDEIPLASGGIVKPTGKPWMGERGPEPVDVTCPGCGHPASWHQDGKCRGDFIFCSCEKVFPSPGS